MEAYLDRVAGRQGRRTKNFRDLMVFGIGIFAPAWRRTLVAAALFLASNVAELVVVVAWTPVPNPTGGLVQAGGCVTA